ncbi:MAG: tetratricopeptide repeat-containing protein [Verrucomicrobia bacterium]|nr:tetratricopeptide repeat-containing protein [Verrucomicrobiota bacterium]
MEGRELPKSRYHGEADEHERDIQRFVNRVNEVKIFSDAVRNIGPGTHQVLTFFGPGGQGKTTLRKRFEQLLADKNLAPNLRWGVVNLERNRNWDSIYAPLFIRNALAKTSGVRCPAFEAAFRLYWKEAQGKQPIPQMNDSCWDIADSAVENTILSAVPVPLLNFVLGRIGATTFRWMRNEMFSRTANILEHLFYQGQLIPIEKIEERLPFILARDLDGWRQDHEDDRFVVLLDEYEGALDLGGASSGHRFTQFDAAIRDLIAQCHGTLFVFLSREELGWSEDWEPVLTGRQHRLTGLDRDSANQFLMLSKVETDEFRSAMLEGARVIDPATGYLSYYPIMLRLEVDLLAQLRRRGKPFQADQFKIDGLDFAVKRRELLERLLRYYTAQLDAILKRLAACRHFDREIFRLLARTFNAGLSDENWHIITELSFVLKTAKPGVFGLANIIRETLYSALEDEDKRETHHALFGYYSERAKVSDLPSMNLAKAEAAAEAFYHCQIIDPKAALHWWNQNGEIFHGAGFDRSVEEVDRECIRLADEIYGAKSAWAVARRAWCGRNLDRQGRHFEAEELYRQCLELDQELCGPEHLDTATSLDRLACNLTHQGRYTEAETFHRRALSIWEKLVGPQHSNTATILNNLAWNLDSQGRYAEAETFHRDALAIWEKLAGPVHPNAATHLNNLAVTLDNLGRYSQAEAFFRYALAIREKLLGPEHPKTVQSLNNLGVTLDNLGRYTEAETLHRTALAIREKLLGLEHTDTATSLTNLARNLDSQGRYIEAETLHRRALAIWEKLLGPEHPNTATTLNNLGSNLNQQGRYSQAEPLLRGVLASREKLLGAEHPNTAQSLGSVAMTLDYQGQYVQAEPLLRAALALREKLLGSEHPDVAVSLNNLASNLDSQGRYTEADPFHQRALAITVRTLGADHPQSAWASFLYAKHLHALGEGESACLKARAAQGILLRAHGPTHVRSVWIADWLASRC